VGVAVDHRAPDDLPALQVPVLESAAHGHDSSPEGPLMAIRLGKLYDALRLADGIDAVAAREAAEEVAGYESRLASIDARLAVLTWMVAALVTLQIAFGVGNLWLILNVLTRLSAGR